ncbi:MAG: hypothetical protein KKE23_04425, partial [Nanoarchaeota archaeon]|nr:hypothetical protein [Nanoarchaeota archaeon]
GYLAKKEEEVVVTFRNKERAIIRQEKEMFGAMGRAVRGIFRKTTHGMPSVTPISVPKALAEEEARMVEKERPAIRLNIVSNISNVVSTIKKSTKRGISEMLEHTKFNKELMKYVHRQDPSRLGIQLEKKVRVAGPSGGIMESIRQRREFAERMKFEKSENVPIMQRKFVRVLIKPFVPIFEKSKPEDFEAVYKKEKELEQRKVEEKPRESKVMGLAIKMDKTLEKAKPVKLLMKETEGDESLNEKFIKQQEKRVLKTIKRHEDEQRELRVLKTIEESEELAREARVSKTIEEHESQGKKPVVVDEKEKDLLRDVTSPNQGKQQSVKKYMLGGLKDVYA